MSQLSKLNGSNPHSYES